jgi:hypothetical protein
MGFCCRAGRPEGCACPSACGRLYLRLACGTANAVCGAISDAAAIALACFFPSVNGLEAESSRGETIITIIHCLRGAQRLCPHLETQLLVKLRGLLSALGIGDKATFPSLGNQLGVRLKLGIGKHSPCGVSEQLLDLDYLGHWLLSAVKVVSLSRRQSGSRSPPDSISATGDAPGRRLQGRKHTGRDLQAEHSLPI